jgi:hypothetical protein
VTIYCDNKTALHAVFAPHRQTNNPYKHLQADFDLIICARGLLAQLTPSISVKHEWVKGHYTGSQRTLKHDLNEIADTMAGTLNNTLKNEDKTPPIPHPLYEAELIHNGHIVTSKLDQIVISALHSTPLQHYIIKSAGWSRSTFYAIDWEAHKMAFTHNSRTKRIGVTKLAHGLYHTNQQSNKYYGTTALCPCCGIATETLPHVFSCQSETAKQNRHEACTQLRERLTTLNTPEKITHSMIHGIFAWESCPDPARPQDTPHRGSVHPIDCTLVQAYREQTEIGWEHFLRGRISLKWSRAYQLFHSKPAQEPITAAPWAKQVIIVLWEYSTNIWKFRNGVKHGHTKEEAIEKELESLRQQVNLEFSLYSQDPFIIPSQFRHLFHSTRLADKLQMGRDSLHCWLRTVKEAKRHQSNFQASLTKISGRLFGQWKLRKKHASMPPSAQQTTSIENAHTSLDTATRPPVSFIQVSTPLPEDLLIHEIDHG